VVKKVLKEKKDSRGRERGREEERDGRETDHDMR